MSSDPTRQTPGWVYVLTNPAMPGLVKIGCTGRTPEDRARELSDGTGVPLRFIVSWAAAVSDWQAVEAETHGLLTPWRVNGNREFFRCSVEDARHAIERAIHGYRLPWWWRLLLGPHRTTTAGARQRSRRRRRAPLSGPLVGILLLLVWLLAWFKPVLPRWLPAPFIHIGYLVEQLHR